MNKKILVFSAIALSALTFAQTGVGVMTENPQGTFHVDAAGDNAATGAPTTAQQVNDMVVLNNGKVGIGTTAPSHKLEVQTSTIYTGVNTGDGIKFSHPLTGSNLIIGVNPSASIIQARDINAITVSTRLSLNPFGGNVGIGTAAPGSKLSVVGLVEYADNAAALGAGLVAGDFYRTGDVLKVVH